MKRKRVVAPQTAPSPGFWSGTISFSLVAIPVRLVSALGPGRLAFHLLHKKDHSPLERRMFCPKESKLVPAEEIIRGYEIAPGRQIVISDQELESISPKRSRTIEITEFIDINEVDPLYFDYPYYLIPLKGGEKAYSLLAEAMKRANKAGVARFVLDEREHIVLLSSQDGALAVSTLHYHDEILPAPGSIKSAKATAAENHKLKNIIGKMMADFDPEKYADKRHEILIHIIKTKMNKKAVVKSPEIEEEEKTTVGIDDLMASLRESMRQMNEADEK